MYIIFFCIENLGRYFLMYSYNVDLYIKRETAFVMTKQHLDLLDQIDYTVRSTTGQIT